MPSYNNVEKLEQHRINCGKQIDFLFQDMEKTREFQQQLAAIKSYYQRAFYKTLCEETGIAIIEQYETLVITLEEVKSGQLKAEEAYEQIQNTTDERHLNIMLRNILNVCEILFWTTVAVASYTASISIGIPLFFLQPLLGLAVTAGTALLFLTSLDNMGTCFDQFKSFDQVNKEHTREKNAVSFFFSRPAKPQEDNQIKTEEPELNLLISSV